MNEKLIENGFYRTAPGTIASISTYLQMRAAPGDLPRARDPDIRRPRLEVGVYRQLFLDVGADYLWVDHARRSDDDLRAILASEETETWTIDADGAAAGFAMLDFGAAGECELRYFGLVKPAIGRGLGRRLLNAAIARAWMRPIERLWVRTGTLDHPAALPLYCKAGFVPYKRHVSVAPDPRATGLLPNDAAPQIAML